MSNYWEDRALATQADALDLAEDADQVLLKTYADAANATLKEYADLVKPWRKADGTYDVNGIKKAMRIDYKFKFKYQRLLSHLDDYINKISKDEQKIINSLLMEVYKTTNLKMIDKNWNLLHEKAVEKVVKTPWTSDGVHYSERIWKNVDKLKAEMKDTMLDSVLKGQNPKKTAKRLIDRFGVSAHNAERLVRTETMAIYSRASRDSYEELGIEQYEILGSPDDSMCEPSGTRHYMYEYDEGHTAPPYHPNCKCCIIPVVD